MQTGYGGNPNTAPDEREERGSAASPGRRITRALQALSSLKWRVVLIGGAALIGTFLVGFTVWLFLPMKDVEPSRLTPRGAFAFFSLTIDRDDTGTSAILARVEKSVAASGMGRGRKIAAKLLIPSVIPRNITGIVALDDESGDSRVVLAVGMGKVIRVLKVFSKPFDSALFSAAHRKKIREGGHRFKVSLGEPEKTKPAAYTFAANTLVLGSSLDAVRGSYRCYKTGPEEELQHTIAGLILQASMQRDGFFYADNSGGKMSSVIKTAEEKYAFAAFPSVDAVATIVGTLRMLPEKLSGTFTFYCVGTDRLEEVRSDVKFLYGAMRRVLRASGLDMRGDIVVQGSTVKLDFTVPGFLDAVLAKLNEEEGEKE